MIKVMVPATSANLGPGFDTLGLALNLYNTFTFEEIPQGLEILGCDEGFNNEDNLIYTSMLKIFEEIGYKVNGIRITVEAEIPVSRGLGSSAACIIGGVMGANQIAGNPLSKDELLKIATEIEGHPDNVAPALFGGLVVSIMEDGKAYHNAINVAKGLKFIALIPEFTLPTKEARGVLPTSVPHKDAVYNVGRVSLFLSALSNGRFDLLKVALKDKLHQPYRGVLIPDFDNILSKCEETGSLGTFLSGAGPTLMALVDEDNNEFIYKIKEYLETIEKTWRVLELNLNLEGATAST